MSWKVEGWVYEHSTLKGSAHRLLLAIAFSAHEDGTGAYPSIGTLAHRVRTTPRAVQQLLPKLVESGELIIQYRAGPRQVNRYTIVMKHNINSGELQSESSHEPEFVDSHDDENFTSSGAGNFTTPIIHGEVSDRAAAMKTSPPIAKRTSPLVVQETSPPTAMRTSPPPAMKTSPKRSRNDPGTESKSKQNVNEPLPQPGQDVCLQPGETGRSSRSQQSSVFPGFTTKEVPETEPTGIGPPPPNSFLVYEQNIGPLSPMLAEQIKDAEEHYGAANIQEAIRIALIQNKRTWAYIEGILRKWATEGRGAPGESFQQRNNRKNYLEEYVPMRGYLPWEDPLVVDHREDVDLAQERRAEPQDADPEAQLIWSAVLDSLRPGLDKPTFATWLAATCGVRFDEQRFVVEVPTPFAIAWLERRMYQNIQKTVQQVTGKLLDIQFQCSA